MLLFIQQTYPVVSDAYWSARNLRLSRFLFGVSINLIVRTTGWLESKYEMSEATKWKLYSFENASLKALKWYKFVEV